MKTTRWIAALLCAAAAVPALAQEAFPGRAISMIVAFPPGGVADITARPTAAAMEKILKQPVSRHQPPRRGRRSGQLRRWPMPSPMATRY